ncbi:MAG: hypothetical protein Q9161_001990 [Pseudevernia consocians]
MISLYYALTFFLVFCLSECNIIYHADCLVWQPFLEVRFAESKARLLALSQEMQVLSKVATNAQGNAGLQKSASLLFDPLIDFYTVAQSTLAVSNSIANRLDTGGYVPGLTYLDTVSLLQVTRSTDRLCIDLGFNESDHTLL